MRTQAGYFFWGLVMKYAKPPLTITRQIELLRRRGMSIADTSKAARYLTHINYYRLSAYWLPFEATHGSDEHNFNPGASFDSALSLYVFDRKFRLLVLEAIERVEVSFRTCVAYQLSLKYGSHAYLKPEIFYRPGLHERYLESLIGEIDRSHETFIEHYREKYDEPSHPPIWAACEVMSFGLLSKWFKNLKHRPDRQAIAKAYNIDERVLASFMHHLTHVRNLGAHHCRMWNRRLVFTMTIPKRPDRVAAFFNHNADRKIYNTLAMLAWLLQRISPGTSWPLRMRRLIEDCSAVNPADMGFPEGWKRFDIWRKSDEV